MRHVWFGPKRFGFGWSPTTVQGWAATGAYIVLLVAGCIGLQSAPAAGAALMVLSTLGFAAIFVATADRRPPRWRSGEDV